MRHRLRTRLGITAVLGLLTVLAGCGKPGGVDGDLTGGWAAIPAPTGFLPVTGTCHLAAFAPVGQRGTYEEVDCKLRHRTETVFVGGYDSPAADADRPPADGSAGSRAAYRTCDLKTSAYLGGAWRAARLWIGVTHPSAAAWTGGARWFRCEVKEISSVEDNNDAVLRTGSLEDALASPSSSLRLTCYGVRLDTNGVIDLMPGVSCTARHNAEFVGVWDAGGLAYPKKDDQWGKFHDGCRGLIAEYVGVPDDEDLQYRTGVISMPGGEDVWALGDHGVRCYLWLDGSTLATSLKGKGAAGLPVQYK
jgi:hypothetical protein